MENQDKNHIADTPENSLQKPEEPMADAMAFSSTAKKERREEAEQKLEEQRRREEEEKRREEEQKCRKGMKEKKERFASWPNERRKNISKIRDVMSGRGSCRERG